MMNISYWDVERTARSFIRTMNNKLKGVPNFWLRRVDTGCRTYVDQNFNITLDTQDILAYVEANGVTTEGATKLLLSHEIFHVILGHFSNKYKDHDKRLLNIAGDLEINSYLGIGHPGITAADYGWSPLLSTETYYQKLVEMSNEAKEEEISIPLNMPSSGNSENEDDTDEVGNVKILDRDGNEVGEIETDDTDEENFGDYEDDEDYEDEDEDDFEEAPENEFNESIERDYGIEIPEDVIINTATSDNLQDNTIDVNISMGSAVDAKKVLKEVAKKVLSEYKNYSLDGLDKIMSKLIRTENEKSIVPHSRKSTYYKLNNRRQNGDFILPGKRLEGGATKKKFDRSLTVFIDVSGSTHGIIANNLKKVAFKLHQQGANIVYYNNGIAGVVKANEPFMTTYDRGGTEIVRVVKEYTEKYDKLERVYVFTDGYDNFTKMGDVCDKYKIFYIGYRNTGNYSRKLACWEKYSDKNPQTNRWG